MITEKTTKVFGSILLGVLLVLIITNSTLFYLYKDSERQRFCDNSTINITYNDDLHLQIKQYMDDMGCDAIHYRREGEYATLPEALKCSYEECIQDFCKFESKILWEQE